MEPIKKINVTFDVTLSKAREWYNSDTRKRKIHMGKEICP